MAGFVKLFVVVSLLFSGLAASAAEKLIRVENKKVCMVTNMLFPRDQIPVQHAGRTYYGCCENCKQTLAQDAAARSATDPVSGKKVDKATAVIGAWPDGSVVYFENQKNLERFAKKGR